MDIHSGARTCPASRALMVSRVREYGWPVTRAAAAAGVSRTTVYKWLRRFEQEGRSGLRDRSSRPHRSPRRTTEARRELVLRLRRSRLAGRTIADQLKMPTSTVSRILRAASLSRARDLEPVEPVVRYERSRPGELIHLDIKKLGRFSGPGHRVTGSREGQSQTGGLGWEYAHVVVDDATRLAYAEVFEDEKGATCAEFMRRAAVFFADHDICIERVMTDNGPGYRSHAFKAEVRKLGARHIFTRPYRPQTNGKAERFIQTMLREWAYVRPYASSALRRRALKPWLRRYNERRRHGSLRGQPPLKRVNDLLAHHT